MSKLIVNEIEKYDAGQLTITTGTDVSIGSDLTVGGSIAGTLSTAAQTNITSVGTLSSLAVSGNLTVDTDALFVDTVNAFVGIRTNSPSYTLDVHNDFRFQNTLQGSLNGYLTCSDTGSITLNFGGTTDPDAGRILYSDFSDTLIFYTDNTEAMRIDSSQNLVFPNGKGIDFSASAGGGATSSLLDDYEEGTFTATITTTSGSVALESAFDTLSYTKIGGLVNIGGEITIASVSSPTGAIILNLPFVPTITPEFSGKPSAHVIVNNSVSKNGGDFAGLITTIPDFRIYISDVSGLLSTNANAQQLQGGSVIVFSLTYKTF